MYFVNHIDFRIVSSHALSEFKNDQAFYLDQIMSGIMRFDGNSREMVLCNYDMWFYWLLRLERIYLSTSIHKQANSRHILGDFKENYLAIVEEQKTWPKIFDPEVIRFLDRCSEPVFEFLSYHIPAELDAEPIVTSYPKLVNLVIYYIQNIVHVLHEIQNLDHHHETPFLSYATLPHLAALKGYCLLRRRAELYYGRYGTTEFQIKNYMQEPVVDPILVGLEQVAPNVWRIAERVDNGGL